MLTNFRLFRHLPRYYRIVTVFTRHGFGRFFRPLQRERRPALSPAGSGKKVKASPLTPAEHLRVALEELGPTFVKLGQILSTRPDLLPFPYIVELSKLQDSVPPQDWEIMQAVLSEEYGRDPEQVFAEIAVEPLGSASLAQVHAATLPDGSQVVLKIQRPKISEIVDADLDILMDLAGYLQRTAWGQLYNPQEIVAQFAHTLHNELDYRREGLNADRFRSNFEGEKHVYIPKVHWDYSTRRVLVLERLYGIKSDDLEALDKDGHNRNEIAEQAAGLITKEMMVDGFFHADPHPGNFLISHGQPAAKGEPPFEVIGTMDFGMVGYISKTDRLNIIQAYAYIERGDAMGLARHLERMGAITAKVDIQELERDIDRMMNEYRGLPFKYIKTPGLVQNIMQIASRFRITLPPDLWLLFKTVMMMDGLARKLAPNFDIFSAFAPHIRQVLTDMHRPRVWGPALLDDIESLAFAMKDIPTIAQGFLHDLLHGETLFSFDIGLNKPTLGRLDRLGTRISLSLLISAFILGLAVLLPLSTGNQLAEILVIIGFIASVSLGVWFIASILRSGK